MTNTELIVNAVVIAFAVGAIIGAVVVDILVAEPARRHRDALLDAQSRRRRLAAEDELSRAVWRRDHLGTPYIREADQHSKRVSPLEVVK